MADMDFWLNRKYAMLQDQGNQPPAPVAAPSPAPGAVSGGGISDPFAGMKAGTTRSFGSFTGQQIGAPGVGTTIVRGSSSPLGMADLLQTQGLTPEQATARVLGAGQANLANAGATRDTVQASLLPAESAATVAKTGAETGLIGQQAKYLGPEAAARIGNLGASSYATRVGGDVAAKEGIAGNQQITDVLNRILANTFLNRLPLTPAPAR